VRIVVEETAPDRLRALARDWGVAGWHTLPPTKLRRAIVAAYDRDVLAEFQRRAAETARARAGAA
jgi:hypothetical protein